VAARPDSVAQSTRGGEVAGSAIPPPARARGDSAPPEARRTTPAPGAPPSDSGARLTAPDAPDSTPGATAARDARRAARPRPSAAAPPPRAAVVPPGAARPATRSVPTVQTHADSLRLCSSPVGAHQRACLFAALDDADADLNRVYRSVIAELRRQSGARAGQGDPEPVRRLREEQRQWLLTRDAQCRERNLGREGPLWAPVRVRCLGEISGQRTRELTNMLARLRAE
jgi:uncharacterized protein YecT (DUF1311 family)